MPKPVKAMHLRFASAGLLLTYFTTVLGEVPPAPTFYHHTIPDSKQIRIAYTCPSHLGRGTKRVVEIRFNQGALSSMQVTLNGRSIGPTLNFQFQEALAKFEAAISSMTPQCGSKDDILLVTGFIRSEPWFAQISWSETYVRTDALWPNPPQAPRSMQR